MAKAQPKKEATIAKKTETADIPVRRGELWQNQTSPFTLMRLLAEDMENMMANFGFGRRFRRPGLTADLFAPGFSLLREPTFFGTIPESANPWMPQVELLRKDERLIVRADLPGIDKDDVKVEIDDDGLTLQGERRQESEEEKEGFFRSERSYGSFYRRIPLPPGVKTESAKATFSNGVLEILIEAPEPAATGRRLEINEAK